MNTKRVILLGLLVMGVAAELALPYGDVAAPSYGANAGISAGVAAASYAAESAPQGGATTIAGRAT